MDNFGKLAERQIAKARAEGKLSGLDGEGAPLRDRPVETGEEAALSAGLRIMAEAGVVPEEFPLKRQLDDARAALADCQSEPQRHAQMRRIADLELRYNIAREARHKFMR